jgi:hypothetical protein
LLVDDILGFEAKKAVRSAPKFHRRQTKTGPHTKTEASTILKPCTPLTRNLESVTPHVAFDGDILAVPTIWLSVTVIFLINSAFSASVVAAARSSNGLSTNPRHGVNEMKDLASCIVWTIESMSNWVLRMFRSILGATKGLEELRVIEPP